MVVFSKRREDKSNLLKQEEKELPDWFRGLSTVQRAAADSLLFSIRDDILQDTSHRVRYALVLMGIEPLVAPSKIKFVMKLSRGNDIAFLWFLMEMYYRTSLDRKSVKKPKYSIIEQILMSCIAYLDVVPTLRELNKLLPEQIEVPKPKTKEPIVKKKKKSGLTSPYFQRQPRPELYGNKLTAKELPHIANISAYGNYKIPNYVASNENNRWFADFKFDKNKTLARAIISEKVDEIFYDKPDEKLTLCAHHHALKAMKENFENDLLVAKRKACEDYFDVEKHFKSESCKRILKQLYSEINKIEKNLNQDEKKSCNFLPRNFENDDGKEKHSNEGKTGRVSYHGVSCQDDKPKFFQAPTANAPYKFNYENIFDTGVCKDVVKDAFTKALESDSSGQISMENDRAITKYCKTEWDKKVKEHKLSLKSKKKTPKEIITMQNKLKTNLINKTDMTTPFDPRNNALMLELLAKGLKEIGKDKKYVLATMPDAHKLPVLLEWVKSRYGMKYTKEEKILSFRRTTQFFNKLRKNVLDVKIPHVLSVSKKGFVSYDCRNYLLKKKNYLMQQFEDKFKDSLLNKTRSCWAAIKPYECRNGPPRNEFFSYIPSRKDDIHYFRPWKSHEFFDATVAWERRQRAERKKFSYAS